MKEMMEEKMKAVMPFVGWFFQDFPSSQFSPVKAVLKRVEAIEFSKTLWRQIPSYWDPIQVGRHGQVNDHEKVYDV